MGGRAVKAVWIRDCRLRLSCCGWITFGWECLAFLVGEGEMIGGGVWPE